MAVTRTDYVVPAGFTITDIFDKLGEALTQIGLLSTPSSWLDSFTDTQGEYRVFAQTIGTGTRNTIYHTFFNKLGTTELWYGVHCDWDVATHRSVGSLYLDFARSYNWPGETPNSTWGTYYVGVAEASNASDFTISTLENTSGNLDLIWCHNASESRIMAFITGSPSIDPNAPALDDVSPPLSMLAVHYQTDRVEFTSTHNLKSNILTGYHDGGSGSQDYTPSSGQTGFYSNNGAAEVLYKLGETGSPTTSNHFYGQGGSGYAENIADSYRGFFRAPIAYPFFTDVHSGDIGSLAGHTDAFTPAQGDTLVAEAGVEEYLVLKALGGADPGQRGYNWLAIVARVI